jgi:eukaryotic-like serine/threonine-protein kinase
MSDQARVPGTVLAGKYRVERVLGEGGMGYVLGARNIALDEPVAIKILKSDAVSSAEAVARFFREARAAVRMKGEHVAKVLDVGELEDGTPYMLMELLEGSDLQAVVDRGGVLPTETAVDYVLQACEALAEAHALGIVHRDIKPSNLFLTVGVDGSPCIKVLDFGISKATSAIDATRPDFGLTETQTVMGSPQYMAPEQMRSSRRVDARTDIWALGTIMHELLTGVPPFVATSMPELFAMILQDPAPSLRVRRPGIPAELDAIVHRCLEKLPDARPGSVHELARMLSPFASEASAGAADRIGRVGRAIANTSDKNLGAIQRLHESSHRIVASGTLRSAGSEVPAFAVAPSASELGLANTTHLGALDAPAGGRPRPLVIGLVAVAAVLVLGGAASFLLRTSGPRASGSEQHAPPSTTSLSSAIVEPPPPALDPPPPATFREPPATPPAVASATGSSPGKRPADGRPGAPGTAAAARPPTSARPVGSQPPPVEAPKPAATASSRYD